VKRNVTVPVGMVPAPATPGTLSATLRVALAVVKFASLSSMNYLRSRHRVRDVLVVDEQMVALLESARPLGLIVVDTLRNQA